MKGRQPGRGWPPLPGLQSPWLNILPLGRVFTTGRATIWYFSNGRFPRLHKAPPYLPSAPLIHPWNGRETSGDWAHSSTSSRAMLPLTALPLGPCLQQEQPLSLASLGLAVPSPCPWPCLGPGALRKAIFGRGLQKESLPAHQGRSYLQPPRNTGQYCFCALCQGAEPRQGPGGGAQTCLSPWDAGTGVSLTLHVPCQPPQG